MASDKRLYLKLAVLDRLTPQLAEYGFAFKKSAEVFVRQQGDGVTAQFSARCTDAQPGYWVAPQVAVRIERVEVIFHQTSGFERKYQKWTPTIGNSVGGYLGKGDIDCHFLLNKEEVVAPVSEEVIDVFRGFAIPYFERYNSMETIEDALNAQPTERTHHALEWFRCSKGLILAKLLDRPYYNQLVETYTEVMRRDNKGFYFKWFEPLVKSLTEIGQVSDRSTTE